MHSFHESSFSMFSVDKTNLKRGWDMPFSIILRENDTWVSYNLKAALDYTLL